MIAAKWGMCYQTIHVPCYSVLVARVAFGIISQLGIKILCISNRHQSLIVGLNLYIIRRGMPLHLFHRRYINNVVFQVYNISILYTWNMSYTWGPPIWTLFHTIIEHASEKEFAQVGPNLYDYITRICALLPCPECQAHAKKYLSNQRINTTSKTILREFVHKFHNMVNRHKNRDEPPITILLQYNDKSLSEVYNNFTTVFSSRGNIRMFADTMQRTMLMRDFKGWLLVNKHVFYQPHPTSP
jgi:hypothetical protein